MMKLRFTNPVAQKGADPWVVRDGDSYYYCYSCGNGVGVARLENLTRIERTNGVCVYTAPEGTAYSHEYWAPELHRIAGEWYIYVAADDGNNHHHRMYVLRGSDDDPTKPFTMIGQITDDTNRWAIDGTILQREGQCYFIWSGWEGEVNVAQHLYIARMRNPWTIEGERVRISSPEYDWECLGGRPAINEGPAVLCRGDTVHIVYSASGSWCDAYCLGLLTCRSGRFLCPDAWEKSPLPLMQKADRAFGPGHCSFTTAADGETWMVYHANLVSGTGWRGRDVRLQPVSWAGDIPVLGHPVSPDDVLEITV